MTQAIYVGAGHSNTDSGAARAGFTEAGLVTELRNLVAEELRSREASVVTDGEGPTNFALSESIKLAKTCGPVRIELHLNSGPAAAKGVECLALIDQKTRAQGIAKAIGDTLEIPLRGDKGWKADTEGQHSRLAFCREGGGIVVECFFLSNDGELNKYQSAKSDLAGAIASALLASA